MESEEIRILITGGSGFIGTNLIESYVKNGFKCLNLDVVAPLNPKVENLWEKVDILNLIELRESLHRFKPTHVLHMAARTDINENKDISGYNVNFKGVENLIEVLNELPSLKRVIFASSMLVCSVGYNPKNYADYSPPNLYGKSKVMMEQIIQQSNTQSYEWTIIRPTSIWGPWFKSPYRDFFDLLIKGRFFKFSGESSTKTFGLIYNAVYQINSLLFADKELVNKKTFYIGDDPAININEWADLIAGKLQKKVVTLPISMVKLVGYFGDLLMYFKIPFPLYSFRIKNMTTNNVVKLLEDTKKIAPLQPYSIEEGVVKTLEWLRKHKTQE